MRRLARIVPSVAALLLLTLLASSRVAVAASERRTCVNGGQQNPDIAAGMTALQRSPTQLGKRLELANLLEKAGCYDEAVHMLEGGQKYNPFNPTLLFSLRRARNMVREEHYREGIDQAEASARMNQEMERCTREHEVAACDEILSQQPNNTKILIAKGDALVKAHRPAEASKAYLRASELAPSTTLAGKLLTLKSQREALLKRCTDGDGDAALQACKSVLVKGAPNEFEITVRMALLQQSSNQASQALDSYIAANSLRRGDKGVALAILALLESTQRKDAIALAAGGSSLVTLGRAHEALAPLRQAKALEPELPDINQQIKTAEALARTESTVHKERPTQMAAVSAESQAMVEPQNFSNVAEATRSN